MMIQRLSKTLIIVSLVALLASCISSPAQNDRPPLRMNYSYWWGDFTMIVARELGLFEKYNVQVEPVYFESFSEALPALATGYVDGGLMGLSDTINVNSNSPVKIVGVSDNGGTNYVVGAPGIDTPAKLKGKRIGVPVGSIYELFVMQTLTQGGLTPRDVTLINTDVADVPSEIGISIDAAYAWNPFASDVVAAGGHTLLESSGIDTIDPVVIVFREEIVQQRPQDVQAFLQAWFEAVEFRRKYPTQANQMIAKALDAQLEGFGGDAYLYTAKDNRFLVSSHEIYGTSALLDAITTSAEFLIRLGALSKKPAIEDLVDLSYIPDAP